MGVVLVSTLNCYKFSRQSQLVKTCFCKLKLRTIYATCSLRQFGSLDFDITSIKNLVRHVADRLFYN